MEVDTERGDGRKRSSHSTKEHRHNGGDSGDGVADTLAVRPRVATRESKQTEGGVQSKAQFNINMDTNSLVFIREVAGKASRNSFRLLFILVVVVVLFVAWVVWSLYTRGDMQSIQSSLDDVLSVVDEIRQMNECAFRGVCPRTFNTTNSSVLVNATALANETTATNT